MVDDHDGLLLGSALALVVNCLLIVPVTGYGSFLYYSEWKSELTQRRGRNKRRTVRTSTTMKYESELKRANKSGIKKSMSTSKNLSDAPLVDKTFISKRNPSMVLFHCFVVMMQLTLLITFQITLFLIFHIRDHDTDDGRQNSTKHKHRQRAVMISNMVTLSSSVVIFNLLILQSTYHTLVEHLYSKSMAQNIWKSMITSEKIYKQSVFVTHYESFIFHNCCGFRRHTEATAAVAAAISPPPPAHHHHINSQNHTGNQFGQSSHSKHNGQSSSLENPNRPLLERISSKKFQHRGMFPRMKQDETGNNHSVLPSSTAAAHSTVMSNHHNKHGTNLMDSSMQRKKSKKMNIEWQMIMKNNWRSVLVFGLIGLCESLVPILILIPMQKPQLHREQFFFYSAGMHATLIVLFCVMPSVMMFMRIVSTYDRIAIRDELTLVICVLMLMFMVFLVILLLYVFVIQKHSEDSDLARHLLIWSSLYPSLLFSLLVCVKTYYPLWRKYNDISLRTYLAHSWIATRCCPRWSSIIRDDDSAIEYYTSHPNRYPCLCCCAWMGPSSSSSSNGCCSCIINGQSSNNPQKERLLASGEHGSPLLDLSVSDMVIGVCDGPPKNIPASSSSSKAELNSASITDPAASGDSSSPFQHSDSHHQREDPSEKYSTLEALLSDKSGFQLFIQHVVREYCLENLLFLIEYAQFKDEILVTHGAHTQQEQLKEMREQLLTQSRLARSRNKLGRTLSNIGARWTGLTHSGSTLSNAVADVTPSSTNSPHVTTTPYRGTPSHSPVFLPVGVKPASDPVRKGLRLPTKRPTLASDKQSSEEEIIKAATFAPSSTRPDRPHGYGKRAPLSKSNPLSDLLDDCSPASGTELSVGAKTTSSYLSTKSATVRLEHSQTDRDLQALASQKTLEMVQEFESKLQSSLVFLPGVYLSSTCEDTLRATRLTFFEGIETSQLNKDFGRFESRVVAFYIKYFDSNSPLMLNISGRNRDSMKGHFETMTAELYRLRRRSDADSVTENNLSLLVVYPCFSEKQRQSVVNSELKRMKSSATHSRQTTMNEESIDNSDLGSPPPKSPGYGTLSALSPPDRQLLGSPLNRVSAALSPAGSSSALSSSSDQTDDFPDGPPKTTSALSMVAEETGSLMTVGPTEDDNDEVIELVSDGLTSTTTGTTTLMSSSIGADPDESGALRSVMDGSSQRTLFSGEGGRGWVTSPESKPMDTPIPDALSSVANGKSTSSLFKYISPYSMRSTDLSDMGSVIGDVVSSSDTSSLFVSPEGENSTLTDQSVSSSTKRMRILKEEQKLRESILVGMEMAAKEIRANLRDSFFRFKHTREWRHWFEKKINTHIFLENVAFKT